MMLNRLLNRRLVNDGPVRRLVTARRLVSNRGLVSSRRLINGRLVNGRLVSRGLGVAVAAAALAAAAPAYAAPQWLTPQTVSQPGQDASHQQVAFDQGGDAVAVWQSAGAQTVIMASARPAGGVFSAPQTLSDPSAYSMSPDVASDAQGDAIAVWLHFDGANARVQAAYRPAGGSFGSPQTLSPAGYEAREPRVAMNGSGEAVLVWSLASGLTEKLQASSAAPGGTFGAPVDLTGFSTVASVPRVALDSHGDAIAVWDGWDGSNIRIEDAIRPAGASFGSSRLLSPSGSNADTPRVTFDAAGNALAVWRFDGSPASTVQGDYRPAGGEFDAPQTVSASSSQPAQAPQVAFDGQGDGVVAWQQSDGSELRVDASVRSPGSAGTFATQSTLDPGGQEAYEPQIAGDGLSGTIVSWKTFNGIANSTQAAVRPAGGSFAPAATVSATGPQESTPEVGIDAQGNGIAVWSRSNGPNYLLEAAGYDGAGPLLRGLTLPSQGVVGQPLQFFQAPLDVWNPVLSEGFSFGDGASAGGVSATHTYSTPGSYQVTATATDVLGNATTVTRTLTIGAPVAAGSPAASAIRCTLAAARTQKLLGKGTIAASATCGASLAAALSGRMTVRVPQARHRGRGRGATRSTLHGYTLKGTKVKLLAGRRIEVHLTLSTGALHTVLAALRQHRQVGLYLTLAGAPGAGSGAHAQVHLASIALARHPRDTPTGRTRNRR
jgi:PKD domain